MRPVIKVAHLSRSFEAVKAVDDVSFEISRGEVVGFLGPNGAGKTTTLRLLTGFLAPDSGEVYIDGELVGEGSVETQRKVGYLPENNPLYKDALVSEILELSADLKGIPENKRKEAFDFVVSSVRIGDVYYRPVVELSKGYKQRVGMAVALLGRPPILVMDEPTEGLDPNQRVEIRSLISGLAADHTIVTSTHVMQEAAAVCSRILIINEGKIVADGTSTELSHLAQAERFLAVEIEGQGVREGLEGLAGVKSLEIENQAAGRLRAHVAVDESAELQPEISRLVRERNWVVWELREEEKGLEDIFHELTKG